MRIKNLPPCPQTGLLLEDNYKRDNSKARYRGEPGRVKSMTVHSGRVALLRDNGDVVVYETSNFDDNGRIIPVTVAQNALISFMHPMSRRIF